MLKKGQIIKLDNNKEYMVVKRVSIHNIKYVYLMTTAKPLEIVIATEKEKDGNVVLSEIKDNDELDYVLSQLAFAKKNKVD